MKGTYFCQPVPNTFLSYFTLIVFGFLCSGTICSKSITSKPFSNLSSLTSISSTSVNFLVNVLFVIPLWIKSSLGFSVVTVSLDLISRIPSSVKTTSISSLLNPMKQFQ